MPLDFPAGPSLGDVYQNWTFNGVQWVITPDARAPFVSRAGDQMAGALEVMFATPPGDDDATPKKYVDDAIASGALYQGTWVALTNVPDLTGTAHQNGWAWVVITSDPHVNEATGVAIPGLPAGTMVGNGDRIVWNAGASEFELIHSPGITQVEADDRYVQQTGDTMTGLLTMDVDPAAGGLSIVSPGTGAAALRMFQGAGNLRVQVGPDGVLALTRPDSLVALDITDTGTVGPAVRVAGAGSGARIEVGTPTGTPPGRGSLNISGSYCINSIQSVLLQRGDLPAADPLGQSATYRNIAGDGRFPVNFGAGAKLRSGPAGEYSLHLYTNGPRMWYGLTADGGPPTLGMWQEVGLRNATVLTTNTNLNDVTYPGTYGSFDFDDAAAPTIFNMPVTPNWAFVLEVIGNAGSRTTQRFTAIGHGNHPTEQRTFTRGRIDVQPWSVWRPIAMLGDVDPQPWWFTRPGGYNWYAPITGYYNLIAAGAGGGGCNWVGAAGSAARYWCGGSGGIAGRRLLMQAGEILHISVPRGGYPAGGTGAQGAANFGPITDVGGGYSSTVINSPNYNSPGMPPGWTNRSLWIVAQFGLSGWNTTPNPAYVEPGSGITVFAGYGPSGTGNTPGGPRGMALGSGPRQIIAQSGRGGSYMEGGGDGMAVIGYDGPT